MKITNLIEAWIKRLEPIPRYGFESLIPLDSIPLGSDFQLVSVDRRMQGWTGNKPATYYHVFIIPQVHNDRTYKTELKFISHRDSEHTPQIIGERVDVWHHKNPNWIVMHAPPVVFPRGQKKLVHDHEKRLWEAYDDQHVYTVYDLLLFPEERKLIDLILHIDYSW